jgi:hypothetical protein
VRKLFLVSLAFVPVWACAGAQSDGNDGTGGAVSGSGGSGSGGKAGTGGAVGNTGGTGSNSGGSNTGGNANTGGTASGSGGGSTGGTASGSGGDSTGGTASGGAGSGGAGSGGAPQYEGDCADKPTWATWHTSPDAASGDLVIFQCTKDQSECEPYMIGEDYLFECTDSHANNCKTQKPEDGSAWTAIDSCENLGFGGMGGMGGGP